MPDELHRVERDTIDPALRRTYTRASAIALAGILLLLAAKAYAAYTSGSSAIYADAGNSASDVAYSLLMGLGLWLSLQPPDVGHPHGHRRIESLVSVVIGAMMTYAAWEAAQGGLRAWRGGQAPALTPSALVVPLVAAAVKGGMYVSVRRFGRESHSPALQAAASDNLADIVSSVVALLGYLGSRLLTPLLDPIAALLVAIWILRAAYGVLSSAVHQLVGGGGSPQLIEAIVEAAGGVAGVVDVERVILEHIGPKISVDIHIRMAADAPLVEVHRVSHEVRARLEEMEEVEHAYIHVEPA